MKANQTTEKLCRKCERWLPLDKFRRERRKDGTYYYSSPCLDCRAFQRANWYAQNKTKLRKKRREYMRIFRATHPDYHKLKQFPSRSDPEKVKAAQQRYRDAHREEINAKARAYYAANRETILARQRRNELKRAYRRQMGTQEQEGERS